MAGVGEEVIEKNDPFVRLLLRLKRTFLETGRNVTYCVIDTPTSVPTTAPVPRVAHAVVQGAQAMQLHS